jgi:hypothetical protein
LPPGESPPDGERKIISSPKLMLTVISKPHGFSVVDCLLKSQQFHANYCISNIRAAIRETFPEAEDDANRRLVIHVSNPRPHIAKSVQTFCDDNLTESLIIPVTHRIWIRQTFRSWIISKASEWTVHLKYDEDYWIQFIQF